MILSYEEALNRPDGVTAIKVPAVRCPRLALIFKGLRLGQYHVQSFSPVLDLP